MVGGVMSEKGGAEGHNGGGGDRPPRARDRNRTESDLTAGAIWAAVLIVVLAFLIVGGLGLWLSVDMSSSNFVKVSIAVKNETAGQKAIVDEVNRQLMAWVALGNFYQRIGIIGGAIGAGLTIIIGMMKNQSLPKTILMAISATVTFMLGAAHPGEEHEKFMSAWRRLYGEVARIHAVREPTDDDMAKLARVLSEAENSLGRKNPVDPADLAPDASVKFAKATKN